MPRTLFANVVLAAAATVTVAAVVGVEVFSVPGGLDAIVSVDLAYESSTAHPGSADHPNVRQIPRRAGEVFLPELGPDRIMVVRHGPGGS